MRVETQLTSRPGQTLQFDCPPFTTHDLFKKGLRSIQENSVLGLCEENWNIRLLREPLSLCAELEVSGVGMSLPRLGFLYQEQFPMDLTSL